MPCSLTNAHVIENIIHRSVHNREGPIGAPFAHAFNTSELTFQLDLKVTVPAGPESHYEQSLDQRGVIVISRASARNGKYTPIYVPILATHLNIHTLRPRNLRPFMKVSF